MTTHPRPPEEPDDRDYQALFAAIVARWDDSPSSQESAIPDHVPDDLDDRGGEVEPRTGAPTEPGEAGPAARPRGRESREDGRHRRTTGPSDPRADGSENAANTDADVDTGWRTHTPPAEEDDFVPPTPAPLPHGDPTFWGALAGLVLGPLWLLYLVVVAPDGSRLPMFLAIALTVAGFALLVSRLPKRRQDDPDDPDSDDGAVV